MNKLQYIARQGDITLKLKYLENEAVLHTVGESTESLERQRVDCYKELRNLDRIYYVNREK